MKNENYYSIQDAFKSLDVLLEEKQEAVFSVNSVKEMEEADQFLKDVENSEELEVIVDPEAVDEEDLKDSYVGYVILRCNTCGTPIFKPEEEIRFEEEVFDADGENNTEVEEKTDIIVNEEDECPHCHNTDGYTIVGKVAPFEKPEEETIKEEEPEVEEPIEEPQEPTPDIDAEEVEEKEEVEESLKEDIDISKLNESETPAIQFADIQNDSALYNQEGEEGIIRAIVALYDKHYGDPEWDQAWKNYQATYRNPMDEYAHFADTDSIRGKLAEYVSDYIYTEEGGCGPMGGEKPEVSGDRLALESQGPTEVYEFYDDGKIRLINLDSLVFSSDWNDGDDPLEIYDTWNIAMTPEELIDNGFGWWQFKNPEKFLAGYNRIVHDDWYNDDDYVLDEAKKQKEPKPLPKRAIEKECEVCPNCEEEKTLNENKVAFNTLNAENVNTLINKYLKETYDNVDTYELKSINNDNAKYYCEGVIKFKSGKEKASRFIFENAKYLTRGKVVLNGLNETFSKSSKAFQLKGTIQENIFNAESLTYQYNAKNLNESVKVFGKVRN